MLHDYVLDIASNAGVEVAVHRERFFSNVAETLWKVLEEISAEPCS